MTQISSILIVTDFSSCATYAAERAAMLSSSLKVSEAALLHVIDESWLDDWKQVLTSTREMQSEINNDVSHSLAQTSKEIESRIGFTLQPRVIVGNTLQTISDLSSDFDLLVLGAHGRHRFRSLVLGTTSQRVLSKTRRPVLVVKRKPSRPYQRVMVAVDFSPNSAKGLAYSRVVAPDSVLYLVHVFEPIFEMHAKVNDFSEEEKKYMTRVQREIETQMTRFVESAGMNPGKPIKMVEYGRAPEKLFEIAKKWNPDLIVIGKHGRSRLEEFLLGSVTMHVLIESECDVLVAQ